jgi:hypothetical protein
VTAPTTQRKSRGRRWASAAAALVLGLFVQLGTAPAAPAAPAGAVGLPGGKRVYTIAMMDGKPQALAVRVAIYEFSLSGIVTERYWAWTQSGISGSGNASWTKTPSGYRTTGCRYTCPIRTPIGFQKTVSPRVYIGKWSMESSSVLTIKWSPTYPTERWRLDTSQPGLVGAQLLNARYTAYGWGIGSNTSASQGVSLSTVYNSPWIAGPFVENAYSPINKSSWIGLSAQDYALCNGGTCLQSTAMTDTNRTKWYHSYFAANPAVDGRKVYWNNQTGVVQQLESPKTSCISAPGGGHTNALLQALDDDGRFVGFVGVEASLNQRKYGQAVVAAYTMLMPSLLSVIGAS